MSSHMDPNIMSYFFDDSDLEAMEIYRIYQKVLITRNDGTIKPAVIKSLDGPNLSITVEWLENDEVYTKILDLKTVQELNPYLIPTFEVDRAAKRAQDMAQASSLKSYCENVLNKYEEIELEQRLKAINKAMEQFQFQ